MVVLISLQMICLSSKANYASHVVSVLSNRVDPVSDVMAP